MEDRRFGAIACVLAFLVPLAPTVGAAPESAGCADACEWLPLYVTAGRVPWEGTTTAYGFSSLAGDAMPSDASTHANSIFRAITRETDGLRLAREDTFRVNLTSARDFSWVDGTITIFAVDAAGQREILSHAQFDTPRPLTPLEFVVESAGGPETLDRARPILGAVGAHVDGTTSTASDSFDSLRAGPASLAANASYATVCVNWENLYCRAVTGRPVTAGATELCRERPPSNFPFGNILGAPVWAARNTVDSTADETLGRKLVCEPVSDDVNESAAIADDSTGDAFDAFRPLPGYPRDEIENATATNATPPHVWRNATFNATIPAHFPRSVDTFSLPSGYRLALEVNLWGVVATPRGYAQTPIVFEVGRADAPTALSIRHATPGAFSDFAYDAAPILPGVHTGVFANATDADDYSFTPPADSTINLTRLASYVRFTLFDPDGRAWSSTDSLVVATSGGRWTLRVERNPSIGFSTANEYAFRLDYLAAEADDGVLIDPGTHAGTLGPGDNVDTYTFFAWKAQRVDVEASFAPDASYRTELIATAGGKFWDATGTAGPGSSTYSARAPTTGYHMLRIVRSYGAGPYSLGLSPDPWGNLTFVPSLTSLPSLGSGGGLFGSGGGVYFSTLNDLRYYSPAAGLSIVRDDNENVRGVTQDGALLRGSDESGAYAMALDAGNMTNALARGGRGVFGPDALYGVWQEPLASKPQAYRMTADRAMQQFSEDNGMLGRLLAAPDGAVYSIGPNGTFRFDVQLGALVASPRPLEAVAAFDIEGGMYTILNGTLVERHDPQTGESRVVARSAKTMYELTGSGSSFFARVSDGSIAVGPAPYPIFDGFEPAFAPALPPELSVASIREGEVVTTIAPPGQNRTILVDVVNSGASTATSFEVEFSIDGFPTYPIGHYASRQTVATLAPGDSRTLSFVWPTGVAVGDRAVRIWVDPPYPNENVAESDEGNNIVYGRSYAWVGGQTEVCQTAMEEVPAGPTLPIIGRPPYQLLGLGPMSDEGWASGLCR